ncbi:hypothetical protein F5Y09DRAFT_347938 [Xylaria sp. FL1042]|nr:hypothetical protein F5Y09DRAFT_347938 [Xylaria sp. FL1042]
MRLLKSMGDVNCQGGRFGNALQAACAGGRYGSALKVACLGGHNDVVNFQLETGARSGSSPGFDAFEAAASRNRLSTLALLIYQAHEMMDTMDKDRFRPEALFRTPSVRL